MVKEQDVPDPVRFLLEPQSSLRDLVRKEGRLVIRGSIEPARLRSPVAPQGPDLEVNARAVVRQWAELLHLKLALSVFAEAADELGLLRGDEIAGRIDEISERAKEVAGWDPVTLVSQNAGALPRGSRDRPPTEHETYEAFEGLKGTALRSARHTLHVCPIGFITGLALGIEQHELAHRCRLAFEGLSAFVRRNDPTVKAIERVVGRSYAAGTTGLADAAEALGLSHPDCVAFLEEHGYRRPPAAVRLRDEERTTILERIREDRLARRGAPRASSDLLRRDVIASQRIEDVDARPWV